jgi:hypothetical protein
MVLPGTLRARRIAAAALLLAVLRGAAWVAGGRFLADASRYEVRYFLDRWRAGTLKLEPVRLDELQAQQTRAAAQDPGNPWIEFELAHLLLSRPRLPLQLIDPAMTARQFEARDRYRHVVMLRPTWELAWANLAVSKVVLGEVDREFFAAMELALRHGPWNQDVQMNIIRTGLSVWPLLPLPLQSQLRQAIYRQAHWRLSPQAAALRPMLAKAGRSDLLCLLEAAPKGCAP